MTEQESKAKFFSQHLGQKILFGDVEYILDGIDKNGVVTINSYIYDKLIDENTDYLSIDDCTLKFRSIADLTDEEAIKCASLLYPAIREDIVPYITFEGRNAFSIFLNCTYKIQGNDYKYTLQIYEDGSFNPMEHISSRGIISGLDYLRAIGILLPFTYINEQNQVITLDPEQIIAKKWAKI